MDQAIHLKWVFLYWGFSQQGVEILREAGSYWQHSVSIACTCESAVVNCHTSD